MSTSRSPVCYRFFHTPIEDAMSQGPHIVQVNISSGGVPKLPIDAGEVTPTGIVGDRQRDTEHHGGPQRALCLLAAERIEALQAEGHPIIPGGAGENVTTRGVDWEAVVPGTRLRLGDAVEIEVTTYTTPCKFIAANFAGGDINRLNQKTNPGWSRVYARILSTGTIRPGDAITILQP